MTFRGKLTASPTLVALFLTGLSGIGEVVFSAQRDASSTFDGVTYLACLVLVFSFWFVLCAAAWALPAPLRNVAAGAVGCLHGGLQAINFQFLKGLGGYVSVETLRMGYRSPRSLVDFAESYLLNGTTFALCIVPAVGLALATRASERQAPSWRQLSAAFVSFGLSLSVLFNSHRVRLLPEVATLIGHLRLGLDDAPVKGLHRSAKMALAPGVAKERSPNILLIINESWSSDDLTYAKAHPEVSPFLSRFLAEPESIEWPSAYTNATLTAISMPSLFTGLAPTRSTRELHAAPFLWDWAKASGYRSLFGSSQKFAPFGLDHFIAGSAPDVFLPAEKISGRLANDLGIDDVEAADALLAAVGREDPGTPLLVVFNSNALHYPFQATSSRVAVSEHLSRRQAAMAFLDAALARLLEGLGAKGFLDDALVVITSDHGETEQRSRGLARAANMYEEIVRIPLVTVLPKRWRQDGEIATTISSRLRSNVSNLDVAATIVSIMPSSKEPRNHALARNMDGQSLFAPNPDERPIKIVNSSDVFWWGDPRFAVVSGSHRFLGGSDSPSELYDVKDDPDQSQNLWPKANQSVRESWMRISTHF